MSHNNLPQNKNAITSGKNDGPLFRFVPPEDTIKVREFCSGGSAPEAPYHLNHYHNQVTVDLSDDGPVFSALDDMMMKLIDAVREIINHHSSILYSTTSLMCSSCLKKHL